MLQYRDTIARPGDGDPLPDFQLNFNRFTRHLSSSRSSCISLPILPSPSLLHILLSSQYLFLGPLPRPAVLPR